VVSGLKSDDEDYHLFEDNQNLTGKKEDVEDKFTRGEFLVLCNVAIYTTGWDEPSIKNVILLRATLSESLYDQMIGRGSRIFEDKKFFRVLDFGGNVARHGLFERVRENGLWHDYKEGSGVVGTKECDPLKTDKEGKKGCARLIHVSYPICPFCGFIFTTPEELKEIELKEIIGGEFKFREMSAIQLRAYAQLNGYKMAWVYRQLYMGNDEKGFRQGMKDLGYESKFIYLTLQRFKNK